MFKFLYLHIYFYLLEFRINLLIYLPLFEGETAFIQGGCFKKICKHYLLVTLWSYACKTLKKRLDNRFYETEKACVKEITHDWGKICFNQSSFLILFIKLLILETWHVLYQKKIRHIKHKQFKLLRNELYL